MTQTARPASDITTTNWTTTPLFSKINDASDATTVRNANGTLTAMEVKLAPLTDPVASTGHVLNHRAFATGASAAEKQTVALYQGGTLIATAFADTNVTRTTMTAYQFTLSGAQADAITDYTDLRVRVSMTTGGATEFLTVADIWLDVPDAPTLIPVSDSATAADSSAGIGLAAADVGVGAEVVADRGLAATEAASADDTAVLLAPPVGTIASTLPSLAQAATIGALDSFNRADGGIGTSDSGHTWIEQTGTWSISSNRAYRSDTTGQSTAVIDTGVSSCSLKVDAILPSGLQDSGVIFGGIDAANYLLFAFTVASGPVYELRLWKQDGLSNFTLLSGPHTVANYSSTTKQARVEWDATAGNIELWWGGTQITTLTLTSGDRTKYAAGTRQGLREHPAPSGSTTVYFDNFTVSTPVISPIPVTGLAYWYRFDDASSLFTNTGRTTGVSADGDSIRGVEDKSGLGNHLSEATNPPTYKVNIVNGLSVVRFTGGSTVLKATSVADATLRTVFIVGRVTDDTVNQYWVDHGAAGNSQVITNPPLPAVAVRAYAGTILDHTVPPDMTEAPHVIGAVYKGDTTSKIGIDGTYTTGQAGNNHAGQVTLGQYPGGSGYALVGDIGEVIGYDRALSDPEMTQVSDYLLAHWALGSTPIVVSDSATAADTASTSAALTASDAGTGADSALLTAPYPVTDTATGADVATVTVPIPVTDTATAVDTAPTLGKTVSDAATGADSAPTLGKTVTDSATAADTAALDTGAVDKVASDTGVATDSVSAFFRTVTDTASGVDTALLAVPGVATISNTLPSVTTALAVSTVAPVVDSFNRADGVIGVSDSGHTWVAQSGTWSISSNRAYRSTSEGQATVVIDSGLTSVALTADAIFAASPDSGVIFGGIDDNNYLMLAFSGAGTNLILWKRDASTFTVLSGPYSVSFANTTQAIRVEWFANSGVIGLWFGGVPIGTFTLSSGDRTKYAAATRQGLREHTTGADRTFFDNYSASLPTEWALATVSNTLGHLSTLTTVRHANTTGWSDEASDTTPAGAGTQVIVVTVGV